MNLKDLLKDISYTCDSDTGGITVSRICYDSRQVIDGALFVAVPGFTVDGHKYIPQAVKNGAAACIVTHAVKDVDCVQVIVKDVRKVLALLSYRFVRMAELPVSLIGVTGTNGKTSITHLLYSLSEEQGEKPGRIGTLGVKTPDYFSEAQRTTPESTDLAETFGKMAASGVKNIFMEVSSHAIALKRVESLEFQVAIFTNLTQDHLDFHENMENYFQVKSRLFENVTESGWSVINIDDPYGKRLFDSLQGNKLAYSMRNPEADVYFDHFSHRVEFGIRGSLMTPEGPVDVDVPLIGLFNAENIAGAVAAWMGLHPGKKPVFSKDLFSPVPGRMEMLPTPRGTVVIDYAHTPDALDKALYAASRLEGRGRMITVFGCGGNRDKEKRALMGQIAEKYSDFIILTNDNPRDEDPKSIIGDILLGINDKGRCMMIPDRGEALENAYVISAPGDVIMVMGKGAEDYVEMQGQRHHFNDREEMEKLIKAGS